MSTLARLRIALLVVALAAIPVTLPQSGPVKGRPSLADFVRQLLRASQPGSAFQDSRGTLDAVAMGMATAKIYKFASVDYPGAASSVVFDSNGTTSVGGFQFNPKATPPTPLTAFTLTNGVYRTLLVPGAAQGSLATAITSTGEILGFFMDASGNTHGFTDTGGGFAVVDWPAPNNGTLPYDINSSGEIVGAFVDTSSVTHGFSDTGASGTGFNQLDYPGATGTIAAGVNASGEIVGQWTDASSNDHGFIYNAGVFTDIEFPLAVDTTVIGVNDGGEIAGYYQTTAGGPFHGFLYSDGTFTTVDVSGAAGTEVARIKNNGSITGVFFDALNENHGDTGH